MLRQRISGAQNLSDTLNSRRATGPFVVAKSAQLRFRLTAKTALAPLLLLSNANPLRWALRWEPPSAAYWVENCRWCGSAAAPGFAEPTCPVQHMGYLIRPLRGHLPLKGKAGGCHFKAFPFRGRWLAEGQTDEAGGQRPPAGRRGRRPLRQNRKIPPSRRGGCPHPPAPEDSSHS